MINGREVICEELASTLTDCLILQYLCELARLLVWLQQVVVGYKDSRELRNVEFCWGSKMAWDNDRKVKAKNAMESCKRSLSHFLKLI